MANSKTKQSPSSQAKRAAAPKGRDEYARKEIRELKRCLGAAIGVLKALADTAPSPVQAELSKLEAEASDLMK